MPCTTKLAEIMDVEKKRHLVEFYAHIVALHDSFRCLSEEM